MMTSSQIQATLNLESDRLAIRVHDCMTGKDKQGDPLFLAGKLDGLHSILLLCFFQSYHISQANNHLAVQSHMERQEEEQLHLSLQTSTGRFC